MAPMTQLRLCAAALALVGSAAFHAPSRAGLSNRRAGATARPRSTNRASMAPRMVETGATAIPAAAVAPGHGGSGSSAMPNPAEIFCNREINFHNLEVGLTVVVMYARDGGRRGGGLPVGWDMSPEP